MPSHPELIAAFEGGVWSGALPPGLTASDPAETERRFAVYRNNVAHSLIEALRSRLPVVERLVGPEFFRAMARVFAEAHPPASPILMAWGEDMPGFLDGFPPVAALPYLADVARLELARGRAFHAADAESLRAEDLVRAAQDPSEAHLRLHPSVQVVVSRYAAVSIWQANQPGAEPKPLRADRPESAMILRDQTFEVHVRAIGPGDAAFLTSLGEGATLLSCASAATRAEAGHDPGPLLAVLAQAGAFTPGNTEDHP